MGFKLVRVDSAEPYKVILRLGSHLIGRGKLLDCNDIRVSRNHAELIVTSDSILLKALHQNPCFIKKKAAVGTIIFCQPGAHVLANGDQFGLIPEQYWYEVIEMSEDTSSPNMDSQEVSSKKSCLNEDATRDDANTQSYAREPPDEDQDCSQSVLGEVFDAPFDLPPDNQASSSTQVQNGQSKSDSIEHMDTSSTEKQLDSSKLATIPDQSEQLQFEHNLPHPSHNIATDNATVEMDQIESNNNHSNTTSNKMSYEDEEVDPVNQQAASENTGNNPNRSPNKRLHSEDNSPLNVKRIKTEPECDDKTTSNEASCSNQAIKKEPDTPQDVKPGPSNVQGPSNVCTNNGLNMPPSPKKPVNNLPRERCWYGASCYRKNPVHKAQFSHPADADWGSGAQGVCPWGAGCARTDPRHWRDHTHPPPARAHHHPPRGRRPGMRAQQRHLNDLYHILNELCGGIMDDNRFLYEDEDSDDDSVDHDYEF